MSILMDDPCRDCGCGLVSQWRWKDLPESYRKALLAQGVRAHQGRALCYRCRYRRSVNGTLLDAERVSFSSADLLDEWHYFVKDRDTYRQNVKAFAEYLGRPFKTVEKALTRAGVRADRPWGTAA